MKPARKGPRTVKPRAKLPALEQPPQTAPASAVCRRCGRPGPVGDDGFCKECETALEQACL